MEDPSIKKVMITSSAAGSLSPEGFQEAMEGGAQRRGGRSRKQPRKILVERENSEVYQEGAGTSPGTLVQLASTAVPGVPSAPVAGMPSDLTKVGAPVGGKPPAPKIIISKTKKRSKVLFTAPKGPVKAAEPNAPKKRTMKRVKMSMKNLTRRLKKANKIRKSATDKSIEDIKKDLIKMELVKSSTKAPEDVLRQIYSDVEVMKKRAL